MERIWLENYPDGVPADLDPGGPEDLLTLFEESFREYRERPAFACMGKTLTFGDVDALSERFAAWLQHGAGLSRGARVAVMLPNLLQYPVVLCGILRAGMVVVTCNPLYTPRELISGRCWTRSSARPSSRPSS